MNSNILNSDEYVSLDYYLHYSKLYESGFYIFQKNNKDYFIDYSDNKKIYSLKEGLDIIYQSFTDNILELPNNIKLGLKKLYMRTLNIDIFKELQNE